MRIHLIAIGGSVMHNFAIALKNKGYEVSGSDDEIFEPSRSRLKKFGLLPVEGWRPEIISNDIDAIILGMHAKKDNTELLKAQKLGLRIYSFPEFIYEQTKDKKRIVIGGSHGKTTITSIIMHVLKYCDYNFDYLVGAHIDGFETMVNISKNSKIAIFEGDEYLSSPIDPRPKFHLYKPHIGLITGIAYDHINVFPTFEKYKEQFKIFIETMDDNRVLIYNSTDENVNQLVNQPTKNIKKISYTTHPSAVFDGKMFLLNNDNIYPVSIFGEHNAQNIEGARQVCIQLGITNEQFYKAIQSFKGADKRLQLLKHNNSTSIYIDFAHSPSKLKATIRAVKSLYPKRKLIACMELHTFSSLSINFLKFYNGSMDDADLPIIYYDPKTVENKNLPAIPDNKIISAFGNSELILFTSKKQLKANFLAYGWENTNLLLMSSGNFSGLDIKDLATQLTK